MYCMCMHSPLLPQVPPACMAGAIDLFHVMSQPSTCTLWCTAVMCEHEHKFVTFRIFCMRVLHTRIKTI